MPSFEFRARNKDGELVEDSIEAINLSAAYHYLNDLYPVIISVKDPGAGKRHRLPSLKREEMGIWLRQFATLLSAGVGLPRSLELGIYDENPRLSHILRQVQVDVRKGRSIYQAFSRHPDLFNYTELRMIRAGEESGRLPQVLDRMSHEVERELKWRGQIKNAFTYPIFVLSLGLFLSWVFLIWVLPALAAVFENLDVELPLITRILLNLTVYLRWEYVVGALAVVGLLALIGRKLWRQYMERLEIRFYQFIEWTPFLGQVFSRVEQVRLLTAFSTMLDSGVTLDQILHTIGNIPKNPQRRRAFQEVKKEVLSGKGVAEMCYQTKLFEPTVTHLLMAGEEAGELDQMARRAGATLDLELERSVNDLLAISEPVMMGLLGIMALFFVVAAFMPLVEILSSFSQSF